MTTTNPRIVVADDEPLSRWSLAEHLRTDGCVVVEAGTGAAALEAVVAGVDLVVAGDTLPDMADFAILRRIGDVDPDVPVILMSARTSVETAVEAMRHGAFQIVHKPCDLDDVAFVVSRALEMAGLRREVRRVHASQGREYDVSAIAGPSAAMEMLRSLLASVSVSPASSVLLMGETGTGKDLVARVLHYSGVRANGPFLGIACAASSETSLAEALFGCERGTSIAPRQRTRGLFELADGGTLFLDAIDEMPPPLQATLLRVLEERSFCRVGGRQPIPANVFVIAATSRNLDDEVRAGRFRPDLLSRLNVLPVLLPPLRKHVEDVPALVAFHVDLFNREFAKKVKGATPAALQALQAYRWPGNIRELRNAVERAMLFANGDWLQASDFPAVVHPNGAAVSAADVPLPACGVNLDALEQSLVAQALERCGGNSTRAGGLLGMNRDQIRYRVEKYRLSRLPHA